MIEAEGAEGEGAPVAVEKFVALTGPCPRAFGVPRVLEPGLSFSGALAETPPTGLNLPMMVAGAFWVGLSSARALPFLRLPGPGLGSEAIFIAWSLFSNPSYEDQSQILNVLDEKRKANEGLAKGQIGFKV